MTSLRLVLLTTLTMVAFAGNSLLCRLALDTTGIDAASFTTIRLFSGALVLWLGTTLLPKKRSGRGNWFSAFALFVYAAGFSFAYINLTAATGALLLFAAVQATMIGYGFYVGERLAAAQLFGLLVALGGLVGLLFPGLNAPPIASAILMLSAGLAWGIYSIQGRGATDPIRETAGNFAGALPFSFLLLLLPDFSLQYDPAGVCYAVVSGALASGLGYILWYLVLPKLKATNAASVQLSVPVIAALGGILFLDESLTLRFVLASIAILGGIMLILRSKSYQRQ